MLMLSLVKIFKMIIRSKKSQNNLSPQKRRWVVTTITCRHRPGDITTNGLRLRQGGGRGHKQRQSWDAAPPKKGPSIHVWERCKYIYFNGWPYASKMLWMHCCWWPQPNVLPTVPGTWIPDQWPGTMELGAVTMGLWRGPVCSKQEQQWAGTGHQ